MATLGDITSILGTEAPAGDLMNATFQAAKAMGLSDVEARFLTMLDAPSEAERQGRPAFVVEQLQRDAQAFSAQNAPALAGVQGLMSTADTATPGQTGATSAAPPAAAVTNQAQQTQTPLVGAPGTTGELNIPFGSDFLQTAIGLYETILQLAQQRELTMEELAFQREVEARLASEYAQSLGFSREQLQFSDRQLAETARQFTQGQQFRETEAVRSQGNIEADRNLQIAAMQANLRANPQSAFEAAFFQDQIQGIGQQANPIIQRLQAAGGQAPAGVSTQGAMTPAVANLMRASTAGAGGTAAVGLGGLEFPRTLGGAELARMNTGQQGVFESGSRAAGNPGAIERSMRALLPSGFGGVGAGVGV